MRCSVMSAIATVGLGLVVLPGGGIAGGKDAKTLLTEAQRKTWCVWLINQLILRRLTL